MTRNSSEDIEATIVTTDAKKSPQKTTGYKQLNTNASQKEPFIRNNSDENSPSGLNDLNIQVQKRAISTG